MPSSAPASEPNLVRTRSRWAVVRWFQRHPYVLDCATALVLAVVCVLSSLDIGHDPDTVPVRHLGVLGVALLLAATLPLIYRRRAPAAVLGIVVVAVGTFVAIGYPEGSVVLPLGVAIYTVASMRPHGFSLRALAVVELVMLPAYAVQWARGSDTPNLAVVLVTSAIALAVPWVLGENINHRRRSFAEMAERAERAERDRAAASQRAVIDERTRIARELHDVVAHAMSVMVVQAAGARRVIDDDPDRAAEALRIIETTGRGGLEEMRHLLGVLRQNRDEGAGPELAPQPGAHDLPALLRTWQDAGLEADIEGHGDLVDLPAGLDLTAYRLVQEALTNTFKHAGPARAHVRVELDEVAVVITVTDDGRGAAATPPDTPGHGLVGMRERVAIYGGTLDAGPASGGGFVVRAVLPLPPGATTGDPAGAAAPLEPRPVPGPDSHPASDPATAEQPLHPPEPAPSGAARRLA